MQEIEKPPNIVEDGPRQSGASWLPGFRVFSEISTWIAVPVILAVIGGKALDKRYGTEPWLLATLAFLGFLVSAYGIVKAVKKYADDIKKGEKK